MSGLAFSVDRGELRLPTMVLHELEFGVQILPCGRRPDRLAAAVRSIAAHHAARLPPAGIEEAERAASFRARALRCGRVLDLGDALVAATAAVRNLVVATRNTTEFEGLDLEIVNP